VAWEAPGVAFPTNLANLGDIPGPVDISGKANQSDLVNVYDGNLSSNVYNRNITATRRGVWVSDTGVLGYSSSSERYKEDIQPYEVNDETIDALQVVSYRYIGQDATEVGLIAEHLVAAGLGWAVFRDKEGHPEGINYELIGVALVPYVQRLAVRVAKLEQRSASAVASDYSSRRSARADDAHS
jgi:hypothetical protein